MNWFLFLPFPFVHPFAISALWFLVFALYGRVKAQRVKTYSSTLSEDLRTPARMQLMLLVHTFCVMIPCSAGDHHCYVPHDEWWPFLETYADVVYLWSNLALWAGVLCGAYYLLRRVLHFFMRKAS